MSGIRQKKPGRCAAVIDIKAEWPRREATHRNGRSALLIRCSDAEAKLIRTAANNEHRTVSGYVLNAVTERMLRLSRQEAGRLAGEQADPV
jgi:uncharacterized protein (DUF1778 family)